VLWCVFVKSVLSLVYCCCSVVAEMCCTNICMGKTWL